jgi:hypothetical protein
MNDKESLTSPDNLPFYLYILQTSPKVKDVHLIDILDDLKSVLD